MEFVHFFGDEFVNFFPDQSNCKQVKQGLLTMSGTAPGSAPVTPAKRTGASTEELQTVEKPRAVARRGGPLIPDNPVREQAPAPVQEEGATAPQAPVPVFTFPNATGAPLPATAVAPALNPGWGVVLQADATDAKGKGKGKDGAKGKGGPPSAKGAPGKGHGSNGTGKGATKGAGAKGKGGKGRGGGRGAFVAAPLGCKMLLAFTGGKGGKVKDQVIVMGVSPEIKENSALRRVVDEVFKGDTAP